MANSKTGSLLVGVVETEDGHAEVLMAAGDDEPLRFVMRAADHKKPVRFAVGRPGNRSTVWRLWANKAKDDVYLAARRSAGIFKASLHESGDWRIQWVAPEGQREGVEWTALDGEETEGRILDQWARTAPSASGWTDALSIWVPHTDVVAVPGDPEPGDGTRWIEPPAAGHAVEFRIVLAPVAPVLVNLSPALAHAGASLALVDGFRLAGGDTVLLFAVASALDPEKSNAIDHFRENRRAEVAPGFDLAPETGPRAAAITTDDDGYRNIWDLALSGRQGRTRG